MADENEEVRPCNITETREEFYDDDVVIVDSLLHNTAKMPAKDKLPQNVLAGRIAQPFIPNDTSAVLDRLYIYEGQIYRANEDYSGVWNSSKFTHVTIGDLIFESFAQGANLFDWLAEAPTNIFERSQSTHGYYAGDKGDFYPENSYRVTEKILLEPNTAYKFPFGSGGLGDNNRVYLCDVNKNILGFVRGTVSDGMLTFTSPNYVSYAVMNMGTLSDENFMVCKASEYPESHIDFDGYKLKILVNSEKIRGDINLSNLKNVIDVSPNMFNKDATGFIDNKFIGSYGYSDASGYKISYPIYVTAGVKYKASHSLSALGDNYKYAIVDENGDYVSSATGLPDGADTGYLVFTPVNSGYIRLNIGTRNSFPTFMLSEYDSFPAEYTPYGKFIASDISLGEKQREEVEAITSGSKLLGKVISLNGDSICYGAGFRGGYGKIIADMFGMVYQNIAVGGATIQAETYYQDQSPRHWICRTISSMRSDADYVILEGGVNDNVSSSMGNLSPSLNSELDDTTFYGAFESMLKQALIRFPGKKIGYIAVHKVDGWNNQNTDVATSKFLAAKRCCEKWGVPFLDLNTQVPPFGNMPGSGDLYTNLKSVYTENGDGWHPNEQGYKKYYVDKIIRWMDSI